MSEEGITHEYVERYLYSLLPKRDPVLSRLEREAAREGVPIVGPLAGTLLYLLASMVKATRILEVGAAIGYSTIWLARVAAKTGGQVISLEIDAGRAQRALENLRKAGLDRFVKIQLGDALVSMKTLKPGFDMIFIDLDKHLYPLLFQGAVGLLDKGGVMVADNTLWGGRVATSDTDEWTEAIREYNRLAFHHPDLESIILPVRDGVTVSIKT